MHDDTASRFTLSASRHSNYECELSLNWSCERLRVYCQTCARFVVVRRHRAVPRIACRLQSAPNGCGNTPPPASLDGHGAIATLQVDGAVRLAVVRIAIATYAALRGELSERNAQRAAQHLQSPPRCCAINAHAHAKVTWCGRATSALAMCNAQLVWAASCFPQRAASAPAAIGNCDCGCDGCSTRSAIVGGCHR